MPWFLRKIELTIRIVAALQGNMKIMKTKLFIAGFILITSAIAFADNAKAASAACQGKPSGTQCTANADGHSGQPGKCDASGNCEPDSTSMTNSPNISNGQGTNGQIVNSVVPGQRGPESQFIKCGRPGQRMCTLCDLIAGLNNIIKFIMRISIGVGLLAFTAAGVMYAISLGETKQTDNAKGLMKNTGIGFVIIFSAWLIINTVIQSLGAYPNLGINITSWGDFECTAKQR